MTKTSTKLIQCNNTHNSTYFCGYRNNSLNQYKNLNGLYNNNDKQFLKCFFSHDLALVYHNFQNIRRVEYTAKQVNFAGNLTLRTSRKDQIHKIKLPQNCNFYIHIDSKFPIFAKSGCH